MKSLYVKVLVALFILMSNLVNISAQEVIVVVNEKFGGFEKAALKQWKINSQLPDKSTVTDLSIKGKMSSTDFGEIARLFPNIESLNLESVTLEGEAGKKVVSSIPNTIETLYLPAECDLFLVEPTLEYNKNIDNVYPNLKWLYCYNNTYISIANGAYIPFVHIKKQGEEDILPHNIGYDINTFAPKPKLSVVGVGLLICSAKNRHIPKSIIMYDRDSKKATLRSWSYTDIDEAPLSRVNHIDITNIFYAMPNKADCPLVGNLVIPKNVESISKRVFASSKFNEVKIEEGSALKSISQELFRGAKMKRITLPSSIDKINASAFMNCSNLREIRLLGSTPASIEEYKDPYTNATIDRLMGMENVTLYVPKGSSKAYLNSPQWMGLSIVEDGEEIVKSGNPILKIDDPNFLYFADPAAEVYNGRVYLYCSHDPEYAVNYETMMDYGLLSSSDLKSWTNHGVILRPSEFSWVRSNMNAPDAAYKDGWYYLYYPGNIYEIGVVKSRNPEGPWEEASPNKITDIFDPTVFVDDDGQAYIYGNYQPQLMGANAELEWYVAGAKLKDNMTELDGSWQRLSDEVVNEAIHIFKRNGKYYFTARKGSRTAYFISDEPLPTERHAKFMGYITPEQRDAPAHNSVIKFNDKWYIFYHRGDVNLGSGCRRSACFEELHFNDDGTIIDVVYTVDGDYLNTNLSQE